MSGNTFNVMHKANSHVRIHTWCLTGKSECIKPKAKQSLSANFDISFDIGRPSLVSGVHSLKACSTEISPVSKIRCNIYPMCNVY